MIYVIATVELKPDTRDAFLQEFRQIVSQVLAEEGCLEYGPTIDVETHLAVQPPARVDAVTFDEIRDRIDGVRFGSLPPLPIKLHWGFFDGRFGASFKDELSARPIVEKVVEANGGSPILALY